MTAFSPADDSPAARAARHVPNNPRPLCRDFTALTGPSAYWCSNCRWNKDLHDDETYRTAVATELRRITAGGAS